MASRAAAKGVSGEQRWLRLRSLPSGRQATFQLLLVHIAFFHGLSSNWNAAGCFFFRQRKAPVLASV
jgi:hypothetical protein